MTAPAPLPSDFLPARSGVASSAGPPVLGWRRLCFTAEGHLDLSWAMVLVSLVLGVLGSACEFLGTHPSPWWWAWLGGFQLSVLIAAVPVAKARILASSTALAAAEHAIGESAVQFTPHQWSVGDPDDGVA